VYAVYGVGLRDTKYWARAKKESNIDFIGKAKISYCIAAAVLVIGIGAMILNAANGNRALNYSLEFLGGTATTVDLGKDYELTELDKEVKPLVMEVTGDANVNMQKVVGSTQVIIKTRTLDVQERIQLTDKLEENLGVDADSVTTENISATVGKEMRRDALLAVVIAVVLMLLYIFIRFRDMRFATSAVIALIHDVLVTLTAYAVLRISVGNSFIAVMLTILGYSINSTIVIFDRIREKLPNLKNQTGLKNLVNDAVNQTLTRSIYTNITTLASIMVLYIVGVASIKEFTLPMMVGIVAGAYSSVFLTGVLWFYMRTKIGQTAVEYKEAEAKAARDAAKAEAQAAREAAKSESGVKSGGEGPRKKKKKRKR
jgi:SecD/SecF fusion protein